MAKKGPGLTTPPSSGFKRREQVTHADKLWNDRHDPQHHRELVDAISENPPERMSPAEVDFIESLNWQLQRGVVLTDKQIDWLEDIHGRD